MKHKRRGWKKDGALITVMTEFYCHKIKVQTTAAETDFKV